MNTEVPSGAESAPADILNDLTPPQREAVLRTEGPLLVLAGPGSGKTRVITRRIAHLIHSGIPPWQILALTFTNKAAAEMRQRVSTLLDESVNVRGLTITTFHALCARLLRRHADIARIPGLDGTFTIYDSSDQLALMKRALDELNLRTSNWPPRGVLSRISEAKNELHDAASFRATADDFYLRTVASAYEQYEKSLRKANAVDFDDLLVLTAKMLRDNEEIRLACNDRWQYLLIDEYQDTNHAQLVLATLLAGSARVTQDGRRIDPNVCVVGDPDQSIYGWRGADITNILEFEEQYPTTQTISLGDNFRSTTQIVATADHLIQHNTQRKHKDLRSMNGDGALIEVMLTRDEHHDAHAVADWCRRVKDDSDDTIAWKDMAVFYRVNALSRVMEEILRGEGIPYIIARGTAFYEREEIKHALSYLRVVANPRDDVSLARIINTPTRGIGATSLNKVRAHAAAGGASLVDGLRVAGMSGIPGVSNRAASSITKFLATLDDWSGAGTFMGSNVPQSLPELVERVIRESGLEAHYRAGRTEQDEARLENLAELVSSAADFERDYRPDDDPANDISETEQTPTPPLLALLRAYLERVTLVADADAVDPSQGALTLMTLHAAKGLEFKAVAMIGLEEGSLPHARGNNSPDELEEERRLCFVGITRAMQRLLMTSARYRTIRGVSERTIPSRFLGEMPDEHRIVSDQSESFDADPWDEPAYGGGGSEFSAGDIVNHPQFGTGRVITVTGGRSARARVDFDDIGPKTLVLRYARLTRH